MMNNIQLADWALELGAGWHPLPTLDRRTCDTFCACHNMGLIKLDTEGDESRFYVKVENCERYIASRV